MPIGRIKTKRDELRWQEAKRAAKRKGLKGKRFYAYANAIFTIRQKRAKQKRRRK